MSDIVSAHTDDRFDVEIVVQADKRLGRNKVHDERSRAFPARVTVDRSRWHDKRIRIYDPLPNPNQPVGCCTGVDNCVRSNAIGNRVYGAVLDMDDAIALYSIGTGLDPFTGTYPPDDTGSNGLAVAKAAQQKGTGGEYRHVFGGADEAIELVMAGIPVGIGSWWYWDMFTPDSNGFIWPTGGRAGGHQYTLRGYDLSDDAGVIRCWWGPFRDVKIKRDKLDSLMRDGGDGIVQDRGQVGQVVA